MRGGDHRRETDHREKCKCLGESPAAQRLPFVDLLEGLTLTQHLRALLADRRSVHCARHIATAAATHAPLTVDTAYRTAVHSVAWTALL